MDNDNIQIYPAKIRLSLNDKATKFLFNQTEENYAKLMNGQQRGVVEKKNHKKHGKITSGYRLQNSEGYTNIAPLDEPARVVLDFCVSEQVNGNDCTTVPIILRGLTGKSTGVNGGTNNGTVNKDQRTMIIQAVDKLMCTQYDPAILQSFDKLNYDGAETVTKAPILPCKRTLKIINGQPTDVIYFLDESPLYKIAKIKGQILTYDFSLLDIPKQNNTPLIITLKHCTLRRVLECPQHYKQLKPILTLDDIFKKTRIENKSNVIKFRARGYIEDFFNFWQEKGLIKSYERTKKVNKFYSIKFTF